MFISDRDGSLEYVLDRSPLASRAWTLQERTLSRRTIHFAKDQMYWECQRHCVAENGSSFRNITRIESFATRDGAGEPASNVLLRRWWHVVRDYVERNLFAESDKLPALAGLASQFHRATGATYLAGVWLEDLPLALLWSTVSGRFNPTGRSTKKWRAPSWSWVSIEGALDCTMNRPLAPGYTVVEQLEILSHDVILRDNKNPFGEVTSAVLRVRGKMQQATRGTEKREWDYGGVLGNLELGFPVNDQGDGLHGHEVFFDNETVEGVVLPTEILCLLVDKRRSDRYGYSSYFLAIERIGPGRFKRIGTGLLKGRSWFDGCSLVSLDLV